MEPRTNLFILLFFLGIQVSYGQSVNFFHIHNGAFQNKELIFAYWDLDGEEVMDNSESACNYEMIESGVEGHRADIIEW